MCSLCNYRTYLIFHLPRLAVLDTLAVTNDARGLAEATYMKKKMYYNMRIKTLQRNTTNVVRKLGEVRQAKVSQVNLNLNVLLRQQKDVEREMHELCSGGGGEPLLRDKLAVLRSGVQAKQAELAETEAVASAARAAVLERSQASTRRLMVELETGGNIRLEDGKPSDVWYSSCVDLVLSRFVRKEYAPYGIDGLRVTRVTRIHNRQLRNLFEEALESQVNTTNGGYKRSLEYLFYGEHPRLPGELARVMEDGFRPAVEYAPSHLNAAVPLSNSVGLCDLPRLRAAIAAEDSAPLQHGAAPAEPNRKLHAQLIVAKVFLARCAPETGVDESGGRRIPIRREDYEGLSSVYRCVEAEGKQREWFVFEPSLVLPEYLVEIEYLEAGYTPEHEPSSAQLQHLGTGLGGSLVGETLSETEAADVASLTRPLLRFAQQCALASPAEPYDDSCTAALNMPPQLRPRAKVYQIEPSVIAAQAQGAPLRELQVLNLHGSAIRTIQGLEDLPALRELVLCFNEIAKLDGLQSLGALERLDLGFNLIKRTDGLGPLPALRELELNNNLIYRVEDVALLRQGAPDISRLNLRSNPVCESKAFRTHVLRSLPQLESLDGIEIKRVEAEAAVRAVEIAHAITPSLLRLHGYAQKRFNYSLRPNTIAEDSSRSCASRTCNDNASMVPWERVEEIDLSHLQLRRLHGLEQLLGLRRASFCNNELSRIEGLEHCALLEELSLEDNRIVRLENLAPLALLCRLDLGKNRIGCIDGLETLTRLTQLSLEDNEITSLAGLAGAHSLMELYIGNNRLEVLNEVQHLKGLMRLIILDLSGNALCVTPDYRSFAVFTLRKLKVLDGVGIEPADMHSAKEKFAGKLTTDVLIERLGHSCWERVLELDLSRSKLRELDALRAHGFCHLRRLNLDSNLLVDLRCLPHLPALTVLSLSHNLVSTRPRSLGPGPALSTAARDAGSHGGLASLASLEVNPARGSTGPKRAVLSLDGPSPAGATSRLQPDQRCPSPQPRVAEAAACAPFTGQ